jgi:hypothetical protein
VVSGAPYERLPSLLKQLRTQSSWGSLVAILIVAVLFLGRVLRILFKAHTMAAIAQDLDFTRQLVKGEDEIPMKAFNRLVTKLRNFRDHRPRQSAGI